MTTSRPRSIAHSLLQLAWPIIGLNILQVLALVVDTAMVGHTPDHQAALTGMGYGSQLVFLLMVAMLGLTVGTVAFVSRAHGAGRRERVGHILHQSTQLTLVLGIAVAVLGNLAAPTVLGLLNAEGAAMDAGLAYLRPLLLGTVFNYLNLLYAAVLRGVGNTRLAFLVALVMNATNVVLNYGLILGNFGLPALGVQGAAIGTVIAQATATLLMVALLHSGAVEGIRPRFRIEPVDHDVVADLVRVGWPAGADMVVLNAALLSIVGMLGALDQAAVGAHTIGLRIQSLAFVPGMSIAQATGAMVGNALGADDPERARAVGRVSMLLTSTLMGALGLLLIAGAHPIVSVFDLQPDQPMFGYAVQWMTLLGWSMPITGGVVSISGVLQGAGATRTVLWTNFGATAVQIPVSWVLGFPMGLGAWGVWFAFPASYALRLLWIAMAYRSDSWSVAGSAA